LYSEIARDGYIEVLLVWSIKDVNL